MSSFSLENYKRIIGPIIKEVYGRFEPTLYIKALDMSASYPHPIYNDSIKPVYSDPIAINCVVQLEPTDKQLTQFGLDLKTNAIAFFSKDVCNDPSVNYKPQTGDQALLYIPQMNIPGTAIFTNNSTTVIGIGTNWSTSLRLYDKMKPLGDANSYEIESIDSDTEVTLKTPWIKHTVYENDIFSGEYEAERPRFYELKDTSKGDPWGHANFWFFWVCGMSHKGENKPEDW